MTESPLILELEQMHDCISCNASEKVHETRIKWLATLSMDAKTVTNLFEIETVNLVSISDKLKAMKEVKEVKVVQKGEQKTWITIRFGESIATAPKLVKSGCTWLQPAWSENGVDKVTMFAPTYGNFRKFLDLADESGYDIKVKSKRYITPKDKVNFDIFSSSGYVQLKSAIELLTPRQYELFDLACRYGYYEEPKKVNLQELGSKLGVTESTTAELLRKAEKKLMPIMSDILRAMK